MAPRLRWVWYLVQRRSASAMSICPIMIENNRATTGTSVVNGCIIHTIEDETLRGQETYGRHTKYTDERVRCRLVQLFMSCCELFFFCQTLISKTASWVKLFFYSFHKDISWMKLEKSSLLQLLPHFSLSTMHEVVGEVILPNTFSKTAQLHLESHS